MFGIRKKKVNYESLWKSSKADQDILMECNQMRSIFQHRTHRGQHIFPSVLKCLNPSDTKKSSTAKITSYELFSQWTFQPTLVYESTCKYKKGKNQEQNWVTDQGSFDSAEIIVLGCDFLVSDFQLQSRNYIHFRTNTLEKSMNLIIPLAIG